MHIKAVTLDATGTLFHSPRLYDIYAEVLGRHGVTTSPHEVRSLFPQVWQELDCRTKLGRDRFASHPQGPRGWWRRFLERLCEHLGSATPSPFAAAELFHRFGQADAWEVFPEIHPTLQTLQDLDVALAVVSNWDDRLVNLIEGLGLAPYFGVVVVSSRLGVAKPNPKIFHHTLGRLDVPACQALHVGDSQLEDVEGALAAGMAAMRIDRRRGAHDPAAFEDLSGLAGYLAAGGDRDA